MARVICPYCFTQQNLTAQEKTCPGCSREVPTDYIRFAQKRGNTTFITTFGTTAHGKTTYLDSLMFSIENLGKISEGTFHDYLDTHTYDRIREIRTQVQQNKVPESTKAKGASQVEPLLLTVHNFLDNEVNNLAFYDLSGEVLNDRDEIGYYTTMIRHVKTVWFLVSLYDLEHNNTDGDSIFDLFNLYRAAMQSISGNLREKSILIIYTKADKVAPTLPMRVREYLSQDAYFNLKKSRRQDLSQLDPYEYIQELRRISTDLEDFTYDSVDGGSALINMIKSMGMNLSFAITSSIGQDVDSSGGASSVEFRRYRVLDPLLWTLTLNQQPPRHGSSDGRRGNRAQFALLLDASKSSKGLYKNNFVSLLYDEMMSRGDVVVYWLGSIEPATAVNQDLPDPPSNRHCLIGPILERLDRETQVLVLTSNPIIDLEDYTHSDWANRVMILSAFKDVVVWEHKQVIFPDKADPGALIDVFVGEA